MQKIVSKYGLAAHLAVMAVAPLFLYPFFDLATTSVVMLWLSLFGFIWLLMEPSRRRNEMPHDARKRVSRAVMRDPLFWFSLVLVAYAGVRMLNSGIGLAYDAELMMWSVREPTFPLLPGCAGASAVFPFAALVALAILMQGVRHALGRSARGAFLLVASVLSALAALVLAFAISYSHEGVIALSRYSVHVASCFGTVFGITLLGGVVAQFTTVEHKWMKAEPLAALGMIGNAVGLVVFSPIPTILVFAVAFVVLTTAAFSLTRHELEGSGSLRCILTVFMAVGAPVLYMLATGDNEVMAQKINAIRTLAPFPEGFFELRKVLSSLALETWKAHPWLGTGLDTFNLDIRFAATATDWAIVSPAQNTALSGWWQLIAERGVIGALMVAVVVGMLLWTYGSRLVGSFSAVRFAPEHVLGPVVLLSIVAITFVDCSILRPEVLLSAGTFLALSGGAFPERVKKVRGEGKGH